MKTLTALLILLGVIAFALSIILRIFPAPLAALEQYIQPAITPFSFIHLTDSCLLLAIALGIYQLIKQ